MSINKTRNIAIILFFIFLLQKELLILWDYIIVRNDGWTFGDWLINYQDGGFKRRGLSGTFLFLLQDITKLNLNIIAFTFIALIYGFFYLFLFLDLKNKRINGCYLFLLLSPVVLLFGINSPGSVGRKEILLLLLSVIYIYMLNRGATKNKVAIGLFSLFVFIASLFHEIFFFYLPYFLFFTYCQNKIKKEPFQYKPVIAIFAASLLAMALIYFWGGAINQGASLNILESRGVDKNAAGGILATPDISVIGYMKLYNYYGYIFSFILGTIPFVVFINRVKEPFINFKSVSIAIFLLLVFSVPLFCTGADWGRWLNIHFVLLLLLCSVFLENSQGKKDLNIIEIKHRIRLLFHDKRIFFVRLLFLLLCIGYIILWKMPHCCDVGIILGLNDTFKSIMF